MTAIPAKDIKAVIERLPRKASVQKKLTALRAILDAWLTVPVKR